LSKEKEEGVSPPRKTYFSDFKNVCHSEIMSKAFLKVKSSRSTSSNFLITVSDFFTGVASNLRAVWIVR
jgi:hypothetical protein